MKTVYFFTNGKNCPACVKLEPTWNSISSSVDDVDFIKVSFENKEDRPTFSKYKVKNVPTILEIDDSDKTIGRYVAFTDGYNFLKSLE